MISLEEILTNIKDLKIINPFTFKYISLKFTDLYTLEIYSELTAPYYKDINLYMSTYKYTQFLEKLFKKNSEENLCENNSCNSPAYFCCSSCHKFFCDSCAKLHSIEYCELNISKTHQKNMELYEKYKKNMLSLNDVQKNWKICECKKGGGLVTTYCEHGLRCENCFCISCDNDYAPENYRFVNLDMILFKFEVENLDYNKIIDVAKNEIENFNNKIVKLFLENKDLIENESRKKRFEKHFLYLRRHFIAYQKIKFITYNSLKKDFNLHLRKLFLLFKYYKLEFKTFENDGNLSQDKNISKLSNFFAKQKPIFFIEKKEEKNDSEKLSEEKKSDRCDNEINEKNNNNRNNNKNENGEEDDEIKSSYFYNETDDINVYNNYIESNNIFPFYDSHNQNLISYYIQFKKNFSKKN